MKRINLRAIAELTDREQRQMQDWIDYKLREYIPTPEQIQARQEQDDDESTNDQSQERR